MARPHADLIRQWLDDETMEIECRINSTYTWETCRGEKMVIDPCWEYRAKPKPVRKVEMWQFVIKRSRNEPPEMTGAFYPSAFDLKEQFPSWFIIQRADWTRIEVDE